MSIDDSLECCEIWSKYESVKKIHRINALKDETDKAYRFYEGDQWHGVEAGNEQLPIYNFIKPIVNYKVSMIAMNSMSINYSVIGKTESRLTALTRWLNERASQNWERLKMDSKCWDIVRNSAVAGDAYIYFYDENLNCQIIDNTDIYFADEKERDIQKQPFIIISERLSVNYIVEQARKNGVLEDEIRNIVSDDDIEDVVTTEKSKADTKADGGKCTSLLYLELTSDGNLKFCRCTKHTVYHPETIVSDYGCYPIAALVNNCKKGSSRGRGEVKPLINNQIEVNRTLARRILNAKINAYPRLVYSSDRITNPSALTEVGVAIEVENGGVSSIKEAIDYLVPPALSGESINLTNELINTTKELAGSGDAALGNVDPTQASARAIIAVRDQAAIPLNEQTAAYRQFVEDIANIWLNTERVYNPGGIKVAEDIVINPNELKDTALSIRIDVSSKSPYSKYAREQSIENLFVGSHITFEEYVEALDDDSSVPKAKLQEILSKRTPPTPTVPIVSGNDETDELALLDAEVKAAQRSQQENELQKLSEMVAASGIQN